ncbi:MAG: AMP-binding protein, partial [Acidimicrobiales bacterium]
MSGPADSGAVVDAFLRPGGVAVDRLAVASRTADGWEEMTHPQLARSCDRVAARLAARGVRPGDRVVLVGDAGGRWVAALLAILRLGAVAVPLDPRLTVAEMAPMVAASTPATVISQAELDELDIDGEGDVDVVGGLRHPDDAAMVVWTSGTTGAPKGVTLS